MATLQELERALVAADRAGDMDAARKLTKVLVEARKDIVNQIPDTQVRGTTPEYVEPSLGEKVVGAGEAALTTATGMTGGTVGMIGGTLKGLAEQILAGKFGTPEAADLVEKSAMEGAQALTYMPRTESGREQAQAVGDFMQQTIPVMPLTAEMGMLGQAVKNATPAVRAATSAGAATAAAKAGQVVDAVKPPVVNAVNAVKNAPARAAEMVGLKDPTPQPTPGTMASGGAAGTDVATMRRAAAQELPVPVELTKGQATRDFEQLRFEQEAAKNPELGTPLRDRAAEQHRAIRQSFESWLDETGAQAPDNRAVGIAVDKALNAKAARDKAEIRVAYKEAEKAGEMVAPVSVQDVVKVLNDSRSAESTAPVLTAARRELIRLGGAVEDASGNLVAIASEPTMKVYRGTKVAESAPGDSARFPAVFTTSVRDYAKQYGDHIAEYELPKRGILDYDLDTRGTPAEALVKEFLIQTGKTTAEKFDRDPRMAMAMQHMIPTKEWVDFVKSKGYDAIDMHTAAQPQNELMVLRPEILQKPGQQPKLGMSLGATEQLRKFVNKVTGNDPTNIKFAGDLKRAIDASTEGAGGELYAKARGLRAKYAEQYENRAVISDLLSNKRGMSDRRVALEDVADRIIFRGSLDDMRFARKVLQTGSEEGKQAWREIQGAAIRNIRDEATKGVTRDTTGAEMISPSGLDKAIKRLDSDGKLDYLFGKRGAEQLRSLNDLSKVLFTAPPGTINTSNTASVLLAALDMAISGTAGMPMPVMSGLRMLTKNVKDRKLRVRIREALQTQTK